MLIIPRHVGDSLHKPDCIAPNGLFFGSDGSDHGRYYQEFNGASERHVYTAPQNSQRLRKPRTLDFPGYIT